MSALWLPSLGQFVYRVLGDRARATAIFEEALAGARDVGAPRSAGLALYEMARMARAEGDRPRALALYGEGLTLHAGTGDWVWAAECLEGIAGATMVGHIQESDGATAPPEEVIRAAHVFGTAEVLRETVFAPLSPARRTDYELDVAAIRAHLGASRFEAAWAKGCSAPLERGIEQALALADEPKPPGSNGKQ